ncbi:MAG: AbrB/MazE/SpoVT family DNA-binding domain-containing protein [Nitrospirota bacterium]
MLITVDKRGSINIPKALRKELGIESGSYLNLEVEEGGAIVLQPVSVYPSIRLSKKGLSKLVEARKSGKGTLPEWMVREIENAETHPE